MTNTPPITITPEHWAIVRNILQKHVPACAVWAFGSRVTGRVKPYSDLDLAVISGTSLGWHLIEDLKEDFSDSDLPWRVDVVDWASTDPAFQAIIARNKVVVQRSGYGVIRCC